MPVHERHCPSCHRLARLVLAVLALLGAAAHSQDGYFDSGWGNGGRLLVPVTTDSNVAKALLLQPDGKLLMVGECWWNLGYQFCSARLRANGSLDPDYGQGGLGYAVHEGFWGYSAAAALLGSGRIVIAGNTALQPERARVARLTPAGQSDTDAGAGSGQHLFDFLQLAPNGLSSSQVHAMAVQPDGRILVAGGAETRRGGVSNHDFAVARLMPDLSGLDPGFGGNDGLSPVGVKLVPFDLNGLGSTLNGEQARAMVLLSDGRVLLAGNVLASGSGAGRVRAGLARLTPAGQLDAGFGNGGRLVVPVHQSVNEDHQVHAMAVDPLGRVLVAGAYRPEPAADLDYLVLRLLPSGTPDLGFGVAGFRTVAFDLGGGDADLGLALAVQSDGRIIVAGTAYTDNNQSRFALARLRDDGSLDTSFGIGGRSLGSFSSSGLGAHLANSAVVGNGGLMVAGMGSPDGGGPVRFGIAKLRLDRVFRNGFQH